MFAFPQTTAPALSQLPAGLMVAITPVVASG
jgi:hypothetical protein